MGAEEAAGNQIVAAIEFHMTQDPISGAVSPSLGMGGMGVSFAENQRGELVEADVAPALGGGGGKPGQGYAAVRSVQGVRRLTPTECERLMAWPDGWTLDHGPSLIDAQQTWPGGPSPVDPPPDGRRYSACGDGVIAAVAEWIGVGFMGVVA